MNRSSSEFSEKSCMNVICNWYETNSGHSWWWRMLNYSNLLEQIHHSMRHTFLLLKFINHWSVMHPKTKYICSTFSRYVFYAKNSVGPPPALSVFYKLFVANPLLLMAVPCVEMYDSMMFLSLKHVVVFFCIYSWTLNVLQQYYFLMNRKILSVNSWSTVRSLKKICRRISSCWKSYLLGCFCIVSLSTSWVI